MMMKMTMMMTMKYLKKNSPDGKKIVVSTVNEFINDLVLLVGIKL